ncbi:hypothetical protein N9118_02770 [Akkermansiaceae bacterium]|nr:hypothetical protein [Akkermansiaceae bacterium]
MLRTIRTETLWSLDRDERASLVAVLCRLGGFFFDLLFFRNTRNIELVSIVPILSANLVPLRLHIPGNWRALTEDSFGFVYDSVAGAVIPKSKLCRSGIHQRKSASR